MRIENETDYTPIKITLDSRKDYDAFFRIMDEVITLNTYTSMKGDDIHLAVQLSNFAANNACDHEGE